MSKRVIKLGILIAFVVGPIFYLQAQNISSGDRFKEEFLNRINKVRAAGCSCGNKFMPPAAPLTWNDDLEDAALEHASDMNQRNYFSHESRDGRNIEDRIVTAGYKFKGFKSFAVGENIAYGQQSIAEVSDGWFKSEGHCRNLMSSDFKEIGIARKGLYWVQDFGGRESFTPEEQRILKNGGKLIYRRSKSGHEAE